MHRTHSISHLIGWYSRPRGQFLWGQMPWGRDRGQKDWDRGRMIWPRGHRQVEDVECYRSSGMAHRTQTAHVPQFTRRQRLVAVYYVILYVMAVNCQLFEVWFDGVRLLFRLLQKLALLVMSWFRLKTKGSKDTLSEERVGSLGLAQYLSKRRKVDGQISALLLSFRKREESFTRELNSTKQICEQKIADFETLIRELAHDRASLQLEKGKMIEYVEDAQNRYICFRSVLKATSINNRCLCRPVHNFCSLYKFQYPNLKKTRLFGLTDGSFQYASPRLWNLLVASLRRSRRKDFWVQNPAAD